MLFLDISMIICICQICNQGMGKTLSHIQKVGYHAKYSNDYTISLSYTNRFRYGAFFQLKCIGSFLTSWQNIFSMYSLEAPRQCASKENQNLCFCPEIQKNIMWTAPLICSYVYIEDIYYFAVNTINIFIQCNKNISIFTSENFNVFIRRDENFMVFTEKE